MASNQWRPNGIGVDLEEPKVIEGGEKRKERKER